MEAAEFKWRSSVLTGHSHENTGRFGSLAVSKSLSALAGTHRADSTNIFGFAYST
ncbi:hypothetical protein [Burkholderia sp. Bp8963]|uniref:hypothetical protein n=1 Tax=Burkholderia sp. Bp8963 TaxID=2184547 RepID=UPI0016397C69|nr:hypothetical protein [Burkholderia sp. Bp8963]